MIDDLQSCVCRTLRLTCVTCTIATIGLAGCLLPRDVPQADAIRSDAAQRLDANSARLRYALVNLTPAMLPLLNARNDPISRIPFTHSARGTGFAKANVPLAVGDIVSVTIFEAQSGGLFIPTDAGARAGNFVTVPNQQIDETGDISVPYAHSVHVAGLLPIAAGAMIASRLKTRAIEPQVVVSLAERRSSEVSVIGDAVTPSRFPIDPGGLRVSGALARVGGSKFPDYDTLFALHRAGAIYRRDLASVLSDPKQDFELQADDVIYLSHSPRFVMVFGGTLDPTLTTISRRATFESKDMYFTEALAKVGGLNTNRADPQAVFLMRYEARKTLQSVGVDVSGFRSDPIACVYAFDLATTDGYFIGDRLQLRSHDIIVVAEAPYADFAKFFILLNEASLVPYQIGTLAKP